MGRTENGEGAGPGAAMVVGMAVLAALAVGAAVVLLARRLADAAMPDGSGAGAPRWGLPSDDHIDAGAARDERRKSE